MKAPMTACSLRVGATIVKSGESIARARGCAPGPQPLRPVSCCSCRTSPPSSSMPCGRAPSTSGCLSNTDRLETIRLISDWQDGSVQLVDRNSSWAGWVAGGWVD